MLVTRPVRRLRLESVSDTVVARAPVELLVRAFDQNGGEIPGIPVALSVIGDAGYEATSSKAMTVSFMKAGPGRVAVSLRGMADTLRFTVVDSTARPLRR